MINNRYKNRFFADDVQFYPDYPKSAAKRYERQDAHVFHRESLTGALTAMRADFLKFINQDLDHEFAFRLDRYNGSTYEQHYIDGKFFKTDCDFDEDRRISKLNIVSTDRYEKILTSIDKEFDLVHDLEPPLHTVRYVKQPLLQIVFPYWPVLYNLIGGTYFLTELSTVFTGDELEDFGFVTSSQRTYFIPGNNDMSPDISGNYYRSADYLGYPTYTRTDGVYYISFDNIKWLVTEVATSLLVYTSLSIEDVFETKSPFEQSPHPFISETTGDKCDMFPVIPYQRVLTNATTVGGTPTIMKPLPDIDGLKAPYDRYIDMSGLPFLFATITPSDEHTTTPTSFGKYADDALHFAGEYFNPVLIYLFYQAYPLMQTSWSEYAIKVAYNPGYADDLEEASTTITLKDAYELGDVIKYVLAAIDTSIIFDSDVFHSEFFYKTANPLTAETYGLTHFVTQKSNILDGDYDHPSTTGIITFGDIEQLLLAANCFWWIDRMNHFRIEHIHYYNNGRSYTTQIVANDLTVQIEPKNQKPWAYRTKKYKYKKGLMPERIDFSWMDEVSTVFMGSPIEIRSAFVEKGNIDTIAVSKFTSDIDYGQAVPENLSKDGFYIMAATFEDDIYTVQFQTLDIPGIALQKVQNGFWSFPFLHEKFHRHNLPAPDVTINKVDTTATTTRRAKVQELVYPSPLEPDAMRLVRTSIGVAEIESMEVNLTSRETKMTVLLDLDFDNPMIQ